VGPSVGEEIAVQALRICKQIHLWMGFFRVQARPKVKAFVAEEK
jgi:hypothetical protein